MTRVTPFPFSQTPNASVDTAAVSTVNPAATPAPTTQPPVATSPGTSSTPTPVPVDEEDAAFGLAISSSLVVAVLLFVLA